MSRAIFCRLPLAGIHGGGTTRIIKAALPGLVVLALAACTAGPMGGADAGAMGSGGSAPGGNTDLATQQACRQRVNEMYEIRNRGDVYTANPSVNAPFSANYQPDVPTRGLSNQFAYGQSVAECEHNTANGADSPTITPPPPPPPTAAKGR